MNHHDQVQKPDLGQELDYSHPLVNGLRFLSPLWAGSGRTADDLIEGVPFALTGSAVWTGSTLGRVLDCRTGSAGATASLPAASFGFPYPMTVVCRVRSTNTGFISNNHVFRYNCNNGVGTGVAYQVRFNGGGTTLVTFSASGSGTTSYSLPTNTWVTLALVITPTGRTLYADGVSVYSDATANTQPVYDANNTMSFGWDSTLSAGDAQLYFDWHGVWARALTVPELKSLTSNPWQMFLPYSLGGSVYYAGSTYRPSLIGFNGGFADFTGGIHG